MPEITLSMLWPLLPTLFWLLAFFRLLIFYRSLKPVQLPVLFLARWPLYFCALFAVFSLFLSENLFAGILSSLLALCFIGILRRERVKPLISELMQCDQAVVESERGFLHIAAHAYEGVYLVDPEKMSYLEVNPAGAAALQYRPKEMVGMHLECVHPDSMPLMEQKITSIAEGKKRRESFTVYAYRKDDTPIFVEITLTSLERRGQRLVLAVGRDLTRWEKSQQHIDQINRVYSMLRLTNRAITREKNEQALFKKICSIAVDEGGFKLAWIGSLQGSAVMPLVWTGINNGYVESLKITADNDDYQSGPVLRSIFEKRVVCVNDVSTSKDFVPWRERAVSRGYHSVASVPLIAGDNVNILALYSADVGAFGEAMQDLLSNLSEDLSNALVNLNVEKEKRAVEKRLKQLSSAVDQSADAVSIMDVHGVIEYVNPRFTELTGYSSSEIIGRTLKILCENQSEQQKLEQILDDLRHGRKWRGEIRNRKKSGDLYWSMDTISPIRDEENTIVQFVSTSEDYTALRKAQDKIEKLAFYDSLTSLPNRRLLHDRMRLAFDNSAAMTTDCAVLFLDIDKFKSINDTVGHQVGDELLKVVAERLKSVVRKRDTVARLGGDEFTVVLVDVSDANQVIYTAERIIDAIQKPITISNQVFNVTTSIGVTMYPDDGEDINEILRNADLAMYHAKSEGRNNFQFYTRELNQKALQQLQLERELKEAISTGELCLYYQPQVDAMTGCVCGVEALLRWQKADRMIPPDVFIPVAEETGLMSIIGEWVLQTACFDAVRFKEAVGKDITMAINLSASQFKNAEVLLQQVQNALTLAGADARSIELELTESMLVENVEQAVRSMHRLREVGLTLAIDDFGTGYSSLSYLKSFPVDKLKIDRSFVKDLHSEASDAAIVSAIIALSYELGMKVIAEGVETQEQLSYLKSNRCSMYQGYFYSAPKPIDEVIPMIIESMANRGETLS